MSQQHSRIQHYSDGGDVYIQKLIAQGEHATLDFKFGITDSKKIARTLSAFANTHGGRLLIGVKDNGAIAGVRSEEEFYMVQAAAELYSRPAVRLDVKEWAVLNKKVLEIIVARSENELVYAPAKDEDKYLVYIRVHDENFPVNAVWLQAYRYKHGTESITLEYKESEEALLKYLEINDHITFNAFCRLCNINHKKAIRILSQFVAMGIVKMDFTLQGVEYRMEGKV